MEARFAAAVELIHTREAEGEIPPPRLVMDVAGALELSGPEHGIRGDTTLCGLPREQVCVMRHLWHPDGIHACERCRAAVG